MQFIFVFVYFMFEIIRPVFLTTGGGGLAGVIYITISTPEKARKLRLLKSLFTMLQLFKFNKTELIDRNG